MEDLLQHVPQAGGEDEDGHVVLVQVVEELLEALPEVRGEESGRFYRCVQTITDEFTAL